MSNERNKVDVSHYDPLLHREQHIAMLKQRVFQLHRWPHYQLLLDDLQELAVQEGGGDKLDPIVAWDGPAKVLSLERTLLYGGKSMFAPIFYGHDYRIREASPESAYERGPYNADMVGPQFMEYGKPCGEFVETNSFDLKIIPNALHHIPVEVHGSALRSAIERQLRPGGYLYIFEQCIEEIHQKPDDYVRYTPDGLSSLLQAAGYQIEWVRTTGNIYTCAAFLLEQILEYIDGTDAPDPKDAISFGMSKGEDIRRIHGMIKGLGNMMAHYPTTKRKYTECPKAFSILARKPV